MKKCKSYQEHDLLIHQPPTKLQSVYALWPITKWGMAIVDPFPQAPSQKKFLLVAVDYFTKWIEAEPLAKITVAQVQGFIWKSIVCQFGISHTMIIDNGRQFIE